MKSTAIPSLNLPSRVHLGDITNVVNTKEPVSSIQFTAPQKGSIHHGENFLPQTSTDHSYCSPTLPARAETSPSLLAARLKIFESDLSGPHERNDESFSVKEMEFSTPCKPKQSLSCNLQMSQSLSPIFSTLSNFCVNDGSSDTSSIFEHRSASESPLSEVGRAFVSSVEEGSKDKSPILEPQPLADLPLTELHKENFSTIMARVVALEKENQMLRARTDTIDKLNKQVCSLRRTVSTERKAKSRLQERLNLTQCIQVPYTRPTECHGTQVHQRNETDTRVDSRRALFQKPVWYLCL